MTRWWFAALVEAFALASIPVGSSSAQSDTLAVEFAAISDLVSAHAEGRVVALAAYFASPGQAPPSTTTTPRPSSRQRTLEDSLGALGAPASADTLHVQASAPIIHGSVATLTVTVRHRGRPGRPRGFYATVEYELVRESGRWVVQRRTVLGIT